MTPPPERTYEIDGLRGWASFAVLLFHVYWEMLGAVIPEMRNSAMGVLLNDRLAIMAFFVLSGDSLGSAFFHRGRSNPFLRQVLKRYLRLTLPVLMCGFLVYGLMITGLDFHRQAAVILQRPGWLGRFLDFEPSLANLLRYCFWDVYTSTSPRNAYNPLLWTMQVELIGSALVYALCAQWHRISRPWPALAGLTIVLFVAAPLLGAFSAGFLLSYLRTQGVLTRLRGDVRWACMAPMLMALGFLATSLRPGAHAGLFAATLLILCVYTQEHLRNFVDSRYSRWLGALSFPLYLVQFPVLISLMSGLAVGFSSDGNVAPGRGVLVAISVVVVACSLLLARLFVPLEARLRQGLDAWISRVSAAARSYQRRFSGAVWPSRVARRMIGQRRR